MRADVLTPNKAHMLDKLLRRCEYVMADDLLRMKTNVLSTYLKVMEEINFFTDPFLEATVYSVPGVIPPDE